MNKKKKILFCIQSFQVGGIQRALEHLLTKLDYNLYDVDIFCSLHSGPYKRVFADYNILKQNRFLWALSVNYRELSGYRKYLAVIFKTISRVLGYLGLDIFDFTLRSVADDITKRDYDTVVAFSEGYVTRMVSYINCPKKIAWIHIDYKRLLYYDSNGKNENREIYEKFYKIVSPSLYSKGSLVEMYPDLEDKFIAIKNIFNEDKINQPSLDETIPNETILDTRFNNDFFTIISVGRVCYEKRFFEIPAIAAKIKNMHASLFRWYIVGSGSDVEVGYVKDMIEKYDVSDCVILLGAKDNPYPYISKSNVLVVTSISETFSYVIAEAKILGVPIITTDFQTAYEVVNDDSGIILPIDSIQNGIIKMMNDKNYYLLLKDKLSNYTYDNSNSMNCINNLLC